MRIDNDFIQTSVILQTITEKIEKFYPEDIALFICYGSYVTGGYEKQSDIDFFFVPKTEKGYELGFQFIIDGVGYDLWPVSWERLERIAALEEQTISILMDGKILFAADDSDIKRVEGIKEKTRQNLKNRELVRTRAKESIEKSKIIHFDLQERDTGAALLGMHIAENLLFALAIMNGTYPRKGIKKIEDELPLFPEKPADFFEKYSRFSRARDENEAIEILRTMIADTERIWEKEYSGMESAPDISWLAGFYEEFKSTYNKLLCACEEKIYEKAFFAAAMIDGETEAFFGRYFDKGTFPDLLQIVMGGDFSAAEAACRIHEKILVDFLRKNNIQINSFQTIDDFVNEFMKTKETET
ncbi:nucleotidyltransferase domain-containing protein [Brucepastera parasyntrophica]|uniref:nucleotidyltransferase domain-containing protein n=1 Tax=Brucepastera parasyntrophica TaxID=2880008 RepID=UPI0021094907|nr:nucleotidyltransferase domain-containing protein [Brucepastera parasyntrophica]ULQ59163.1 nucleotidyltransferase domain-containing protein [Brucepastera parasyntrophica]